jgi:ribosomal protein S6--L-glutamate ligase
MLDVKGVPRVFEVNSSPSIKEAETACGVDAAGRIVERAVALAEAVRRGAARPPRGARAPGRRAVRAHA